MKNNPTNITSEGASKKLVPELRFPEFVNEGEWMEQLLGNCLSQTPDYGLNAPAIPYSLLKPTYLRITDIDDNGRFVSDKKMSVETEMTDKNSLAEGDIVFARTGASVGKVYKYRVEDGPLVFAGFLIRVRPNISKYSSEYIFQYLFTDAYKRWVQVTSARSGQPGINSNEYASLRIPFPTLDEQRQIAQCLSSLDELIAATKEKVVLLKEHKRGLLQKLFPAKGKTLPELRFPEFKDEGEWKMIRFGSLIDESNEVSKREDEDILLSSTINGIILHSELFSHQRGSSNVGYRKLKKNMLVLSAQNLHLGNANVNTRFEHGLISPAYKIFNILNCDVLFLSQWIKKNTTNQFFYDATTAGASACRRNVVWDDLYNQRILLPSIVEQQKIVSVLSSLDNQIEQYNEKVKALESHKKGLMQKLFPKK